MTQGHLDPHPHRRRDLALLALSSLLLYGIALGARDLWNPNEGTYGRVVVEMLEGDDWLVPRLHGEPFVEKPILYYWLAAMVSGVAGGVSEATLRLPVMVANLLSVLLTYLLVESYDGRRRALVASALFATSYAVWFTARNAQMDSFVLLGTLGSVLALARRIDGDWGGRRSWLVAAAAMGLGCAAKGPVAVVLPGLILGTYVVVGRKPWRPLLVGLPLGAVAFLALASPWYVALFFAGRTEALHELLVRQNVSRFLAAWDHVQPWWYYLEYFWLTFAPWSWFVPVAAVVALRRQVDEAGRPLSHLLPWVYLLVPLVFFSLSESKREPYMLPAAPAVAWLAASVLDAFHRRALSRRLQLVCNSVAGALGAILLLGGLWVAWPGTIERSPVAVSGVPLALVAIAGGALVVGTTFSRKRRHQAPLALLGAFLALYALVAAYLHPAANAIKSHHRIASELRQHIPAGHPLSSFFGPRWRLRGGYAYYLQQRLPDLKDAEGLRAAWAAEDELCVVTEGEELHPAMRSLENAVTVYEDQVGSSTVRLVCQVGPRGPRPGEAPDRASSPWLASLVRQGGRMPYPPPVTTDRSCQASTASSSTARAASPSGLAVGISSTDGAVPHATRSISILSSALPPVGSAFDAKAMTPPFSPGYAGSVAGTVRGRDAPGWACANVLSRER